MQGTATEEQMQILEEHLLTLCKSEEEEMKFEAQRYLASFYITGQRFEEAEKVLATLPDFDFNARHLKALLVFVKKEYEAARKECEQFLFECVQNALICLSRLAGIAMETKDSEKERMYAEMMCRMEQELGIPFYRGATQMIEYYLHSGEEESAVNCFEAYVDGTLVSLEAFREEIVQVLQNPAYRKRFPPFLFF